MLHPANIALLPSNWRWSGWFTAEDYLKVFKVSHGFAFKIIQIKRAHMFLYVSLVIILYFLQFWFCEDPHWIQWLSKRAAGSADEERNGKCQRRTVEGCPGILQRAKEQRSRQFGVCSLVCQNTVHWSSQTLLWKHRLKKAGIQNEKIWPATRVWWRGSRPLQTCWIAIQCWGVKTNKGLITAVWFLTQLMLRKFVYIKRFMAAVH